MTGTITNPIKFASVITHAGVLPGDSIYLRGGTYTGDWITSINGTSEAPITIQPYNNEPVTINGSLQIGGIHTHWRDITIINSADNVVNSALYLTQPGTWIDGFDISCSGAMQGISWFGSGVGKLINSTIHNTLDYGIYAHNHLGGLREITNCTFSNIGGYYDIHLYSDGNKVRDYVISGCTMNKPRVVHSGYEVSGIKFINNTFHNWLKIGNGRTVVDTRESIVTGNVFEGEGIGLSIIDPSTTQVLDNTFVVKQRPNQQVNIGISHNINFVGEVIDGNHYTSGLFSLEDVYPKTFTEWQGFGYDLQGTYK